MTGWVFSVQLFHLLLHVRYLAHLSVTPSASQLPSMTNRQIKDVVPKAWSSARKNAFQKFGTVCSNPLFEKGPLDRRESVCLAAISRR
jgi:hypothetical protein